MLPEIRDIDPDRSTRSATLIPDRLSSSHGHDSGWISEGEWMVPRTAGRWGQFGATSSMWRHGPRGRQSANSRSKHSPTGWPPQITYQAARMMDSRIDSFNFVSARYQYTSSSLDIFAVCGGALSKCTHNLFGRVSASNLRLRPSDYLYNIVY
jgi:hypothetical protein